MVFALRRVKCVRSSSMKSSNNTPFPPITELIPQRPPVVMVDQVLACDGTWTTTSFVVPQSGIFVENGALSEVGLIENMAQSSFIFLHYINAPDGQSIFPQQGRAIGFISNIVQLSVLGQARVDQQLLTQLRTELVFTSENLKICKVMGDIRVENEVIFSATMTMLLQLQEG